jgi:TrmH family RNA methyltransferase
LVGAAPSATVDYQTVDYRGPVLLLLGGERKGLSSDLQALCDVVVRIPMSGQTDSLNLSVAASLLLYEAFNQRRRGTITPSRRHGAGASGRSAP